MNDVLVGLLLISTQATVMVEHDGPIVLGDTTEVPVVIRTEADDRPLRVAVNVGSFQNLSKVEPGVHRASFVLPGSRHPQVAYVAVWRETGTDAEITFVPIPLHGKTTLPVTTEAAAEVRVVVGTNEFGPVRADPQGHAELPIVVPPGLAEVVALSRSKGLQGQLSVQTGVPPYNRLTLAVTPYLIPADGAAWCRVLAYYDVDDPPSIDQVELTAGAGRITPLGRDGKVYSFKYVPARNPDARTVDLAVRVNEDEASSANARISLGTPMPEHVIVQTIETRLVADAGRQTEMSVLVVDRLGLGVEGLRLDVTVEWAAVVETKDLGSGRYVVTLAAGPDDARPASWRVSGTVIAASVKRSFQLPVHAPAWPVRATLTVNPERPLSDGETPFELLISAYDAADEPFDGAHLTVTPAAEVQPIGAGRYVAMITPELADNEIEVTVTDATGHLAEKRMVALEAPYARLTLGAGAGAGYNASVSPFVGVELALRPTVARGWLSVYAAASHRQMSQAILPTVSARIRLLGVSAGANLELLQDTRWRFYVGAGARLEVYRQDFSAQGFASDAGAAFGGEAQIGAAFSGVFVEVKGTFVPINTDDLFVPSPGIFGVAGYRMGVL